MKLGAAVADDNEDTSVSDLEDDPELKTDDEEDMGDTVGPLSGFPNQSRSVECKRRTHAPSIYLLCQRRLIRILYVCTYRRHKRQ